ncbi:hypothetical protein [Paenibacillus koleovorans]|uniref:hypothetical protein n=1 Tax=Paenibacillus koleovorans TaxID=121608 RepID=UPI000FD81A93|nr:hypothetical protein [Paenibacillus koleovorans]
MQTQLNAVLTRLQERESLQLLTPTKAWDPALEAQIEAIRRAATRPDTMQIALIAGLHLRNDNLDVSHSYAQQIEHDATGAYWHGIMHRMEGDYWNAKYWFRQAGRHPVMEIAKQQIAEWLKAHIDETTLPHSHAGEVLQTFRDASAWNPSSFVDLVDWQQSGQAGSSEQTRTILEHLQQMEMNALFDYTAAKAALK